MRNYFTFGDYDSRDFGVFITRDGVYNAPRRVYRQIQVPGRNGDLMLDEGRFENIDVTYPCLIYAGFNANIEGLRNALLSQKGYVRITDSYHPDEYRLGCFTEEFSVVPKALGDGGTFEVAFNCKPQRFLLSGEEAITYPPGGANSPNLIPYPYYWNSRTVNGITFTVNTDGTIEVSGTATALAVFYLRASTSGNFGLVDGETYILTGCPPSGSSITYKLDLLDTTSSQAAIASDFGSGRTFTYDATRKPGAMRIVVYSGVTLDVVFKPMLRLASDTDSKWYPYWDGTKQIYNPTLFASKPLIRATFDTANENHIKMPYSDGSPYESNGITYTTEADGSIRAVGTCGSTRSYYSCRAYNDPTHLPPGNYHFEGCPAGGSSSKYYLTLWFRYNGAQVGTSRLDYGTGGLDFTITETESQYDAMIQIYVQPGTTIDELFTPTLVADTDEVYFYVGSDKITLQNRFAYIDIDSDIQDCYSGYSNANPYVKFQSNDFPVLEPGVTGITLGAGIESIEVTPRWYIV